MQILPDLDRDVLGLQLTANRYSLTGYFKSFQHINGNVFIEKKNYNGFFQPHFIRVSALRHYLVSPNIDAKDFVVFKEGKESMTEICRNLRQEFGGNKSVLNLDHSILTFQETLHANKLTSNYSNYLKDMNLPLPDNKEVTDIGWLVNDTEQVITFRGGNSKILNPRSKARTFFTMFLYWLGFRRL
jgi:hypothetical protein